MRSATTPIRSLSVTGDNPDAVERSVLNRAGAGGASGWFADERVDRSLEYSSGFHIDHCVITKQPCERLG